MSANLFRRERRKAKISPFHPETGAADGLSDSCASGCRNIPTPSRPPAPVAGPPSSSRDASLAAAGGGFSSCDGSAR